MQEGLKKDALYNIIETGKLIIKKDQDKNQVKK